MTSTCPCSGLGSESVFLVVDRPYYPSAGERTERKKTGKCPCACEVPALKPTFKTPMTGEERIRMLKAKITGNCCQTCGATSATCAWPANWATR